MCEGLVLQNVSGPVPKQICWPFPLNVLGLLKLAGHLAIYDLAACRLSLNRPTQLACLIAVIRSAAGVAMVSRSERCGVVCELTCVNCKRGEA